MSSLLTDVEVRVLGSLIEKQVTTPEYYPLTLNALANACNQKSNRAPIMHLDEYAVVRALDGLRDKKIVWMVSAANSRTPKYEHSVPKVLDLAPDEVALLCLLMLRGPQTAGELRGRSGRLHTFAGVTDVEETLERLAARSDGPFVVMLPRQSGHKERRYMHLLAGEPEFEEQSMEPAPEQARVLVREEDGRMAALEASVTDLASELASLRAEFDAFKDQFA